MRQRFLALIAAFAVLGSLAQAHASTISIRVISAFDYPDPAWTIANTGGINDSGTSVGLVLSDTGGGSFRPQSRWNVHAAFHATARQWLPGLWDQ